MIWSNVYEYDVCKLQFQQLWNKVEYKDDKEDYKILILKDKKKLFKEKSIIIIR